MNVPRNVVEDKATRKTRELYRLFLETISLQIQREFHGYIKLPVSVKWYQLDAATREYLTNQVCEIVEGIWERSPN